MVLWRCSAMGTDGQPRGKHRVLQHFGPYPVRLDHCCMQALKPPSKHVGPVALSSLLPSTGPVSLVQAKLSLNSLLG